MRRASTPPDLPAWGREYKRTLRDYYTHTVRFMAHLTSLPAAGNSISLDPTVKDKWGSREKLIAAIGEQTKSGKDKDYLTKLGSFPLPRLLVHEVFLAVLPALLRFLSARSTTAWGHILTSAEEALQPHCTGDLIRP